MTRDRGLWNPTSRNIGEKWGTPFFHSHCFYSSLIHPGLMPQLDSQGLLSAYGAVGVAHFVAFEVFDVVDGLDGVLAAGGNGAGVSVVRMEMIIDVAVETFGTVEPGTDADEDAAGEPLRSVVAVGGAVVGLDVVVAVGTDGGDSNFDGYLSLGLRSGYGEADCGDGC